MIPHTSRIFSTPSQTLLALLAIIVLLSPPSIRAFSVYEEQSARTGMQRIGLISGVKPDQREALDMAIKKAPESLDSDLEKAGIYNLSLFTKEIDNRTWCFAHFEFRGDRELAVTNFLKASTFTANLGQFLAPHARATETWLRMEWITHVPGAGKPTEDYRGKREKFGLVTSLKAEKEAEYRTLHQTVWPGVNDQIGRSQYRDWTTFLIEIDAKIYLFSYFEYLGKNMDADNAAMKADPVTQRWWKLTDACMEPLPEQKNGFWTAMKPLRVTP